MVTGRGKNFVGFLPVVLVSVMLVGCEGGGGSVTPTPAQSGDGMEVQQARAEYIDLLRRIEDMAPGDWERAERPVGDQCRFPNGATGTQFGDGSSRDSLPSDDVDALQAQVKAFFEAQGFRVESSQDPGDYKVLRVVGFGPDKLTVRFTASSRALAVGGTSRCSVDPEGQYR